MLSTQTRIAPLAAEFIGMAAGPTTVSLERRDGPYSDAVELSDPRGISEHVDAAPTAITGQKATPHRGHYR